MTGIRSTTRRGWLVAAFALAAVGFGLIMPAAAAYPEKPIRIVVPSSPGGSADAVARMLGERLSKVLGQSVVIENKGGGGGNIATELVAKSPADGYTVLLTGNNHTLNVSLFARAPYKLEDFTPVIELTRGPSVFVTGAQAPFANLADLVAKAKAAPDSIAYGSPGIGLPSHVAAEMFQRAVDIRLIHVPYKGSGPSLLDAISGQVPVVSSTLAAAMPHIKAGKLRALAVTSAERRPSLLDAPTAAETVAPGYSHLTWLGLLVPAGTPPDVVARLNAEVAKVLADPEVKAWLEMQGTSPVGGSSASFEQMLAEEAVASKALVESAGLRAQ